MSRIVGISLTLSFGFLGILTSTFLWNLFGFDAILQTLAILLIATFGEHIVSGKGYYHYTDKNGIFIGRVPLWIPFMWVAIIQGSLLISLAFGLISLDAIALSGIFCASLDFYILEPLLSSKLGMWQWKSVQGGYFSFIPSYANRFTAPFGNYLIWLFFPIILNWLLRFAFIIHSIL